MRTRDPLVEALARNAVHRAEVAAVSGPMLSEHDAARLIGITPRELSEIRRRHEVIAVRRDARWVYPGIQISDGRLVPGLEQMLPLMAAHGPWVMLDALTAPDSALGGLSAIEALRRGMVDEVVRVTLIGLGDGYA